MRTRVMKKMNLLCIIIAAVLCVSVAHAVPTEILPESSLYEGTSYFTESSANGMLYGRVDFAVYDTFGGNEYLNAGNSAPGSGRYIYAYQLFNAPGNANPLEYFEIYKDDGTAISGIDSIDSHDDGNGGIDPTDAYASGDMTKGIWAFDNGLLIAGKHSWFLVLSSNNTYTTGKFKVTPTPDDEIILPGDIPEPASLALIGIGSLLMAMKKRKSRHP